MIGGRRSIRRGVIQVSVCVALLIAGQNHLVRAHEIGKTQIAATFNRDGSYIIDVTVDPDALLLQLELSRDGSVTQVPEAAERDRLLAAMGDVYRRGVELTADGVPLSSSFDYLGMSASASAAPGTAIVRLKGTLPSEARGLTVRYDWAGGTFAFAARVFGTATRTFWIEPKATSQTIPLERGEPPQTRWDIFLQYLVLGVTHIVPGGVDHMLFVVSLCLLRLEWRAIVAQISAFTLAHSLALAMTAYGLVSLSPRIVEPIIALSIAYVAIENLLVTDLRRSRTILVFFFGLLHGMGFASVLHEVGLPKGELLSALVSFNIGVELGQLAVVGAVVVLLGRWALEGDRYRRWILQPSSALIAIIALYWTAQRVL